MLRDGQFIKEDPPKISAHYVPPIKAEYNPEEQFAQNLLLEKPNRESLIAKFVGIMRGVTSWA